MHSRRRLALVIGLVTLALGAGALGPVADSFAAQPDGVSFKLEGCRNDGTIVLPNGSGQFICPDSAYTTGNLGKGWNELDLVPYRLVADAGNSAPATQTYTVAIVLDNEDAGRPGYDVLSTPVLNTTLSDAGCAAPTVGAEQILTPGLGGIDESRYRLVTITQARNKECVYDYFGRLALGSHLFPGSALHANLANETLGTAGIGSKDVSIPVKEIEPQSIAKDMTASQGSDHIWDITKSATPATVSFGDTCDPEEPTSAGVGIKITWEKKAATPSGPITVITKVYATNPAARTITVNVTDVIKSGTTTLHTVSSGPVDVNANTANFLVLTHQTEVPAGTTNLNDVATATYTDKVTGVPVPGTTTATASAAVQLTGTELNQTATINDTESISGSAFKFSADSFSPMGSGSFDLYLAGTPTTGPVSWTSVSQNGNGQVEFAKTVYVSSGTSASGTLSDTATLTGSDGFSASASASVGVSADARVSLTIDKSIPNVLQGDEEQTFSFVVKDSNDVTVATPSLTFEAGDTDKSITIDNLAPDEYTVSEDAATGWLPQDPQTVDITLPNCSGTATFTNDFGPASASAIKLTNPKGAEADWAMTLNGPGTPSGGEEVLTDSTGSAPFTTQLQEGSYTITETVKDGWDKTDESGDCSFTVDYPADSGRQYTCTFTNVQRGKIIVKKVTDPKESTQLFDFEASYDADGFQLQGGGENDSGALVPGTYSVSEKVPAGWDLDDVGCSDGSLASKIELEAGETVTCTFTNVQRGKIIVKKVTDPKDSTQLFDFEASYDADGFQLQGGGENDSGALVPGDYSVSEKVPAGWDLDDVGCSDGSLASKIELQAGETVTCTFRNVQRGKIIVKKVTDPKESTQLFDFEASYDADGFQLQGGGENDSGPLEPGDYSVSEKVPAGWDLDDVGCSDGELSRPRSSWPRARR